MQCVYLIRNVTNQKVYVGSTVRSRARFQTHRRALRKGSHHCRYLQAAWNKYGEDCFKFEVLEVVDAVDQLFVIENRWLSEMLVAGRAYNTAPCAGATWRGVQKESHPSWGTKRSEETKAQMRASIKAWCEANPDKVAKGETHYRYGKTLDETTRKKIGDTQRGVKKGPRTISEEGRAKIAAAAAAGHYGHCKGRKRPASDFATRVRPIVELTSGREFVSLNDALREYGLHMPTLRRALLTGKPLAKGPHAGLMFTYLTPP